MCGRRERERECVGEDGDMEREYVCVFLYVCVCLRECVGVCGGLRGFMLGGKLCVVS